jgi:hypothetical protein
MRRRFRTFRLVALLLIGANAAFAGAQSSGGPYRIEPVAVANGGGRLSGGAYQLSGTLGQSQVSTSSAPGYRLYSGFWAPTSDVIFVNGFDP